MAGGRVDTVESANHTHMHGGTQSFPYKKRPPSASNQGEQEGPRVSSSMNAYASDRAAGAGAPRWVSPVPSKDDHHPFPFDKREVTGGLPFHPSVYHKVRPKSPA